MNDLNQPIKVCLFVRVSDKDKQSNERQITDLTNFCTQKRWDVVKTIESKITGTKTYIDRDDLKTLFKSADKKEFDKVIISEISRLGRVSKDIHNTVYKLHENKISIVFHQFGGLESLNEQGEETFVVNIIISIYAELAAEERKILVQRVKSGVQNARAKGKILGRPRGKTPKDEILKQYSKLIKDIKAGLSLSKCMAVHNVSKNTVIKVKRLINPPSNKEA